MTIGWHDDQFIRQEITDEFVDQKVAGLRTIKETFSRIEPVLCLSFASTYPSSAECH